MQLWRLHPQGAASSFPSWGGSGGASLSGKVVGDSFYVLLEKKATPATAGGGCCADTLRVYDRLSEAFVDHDIDAVLDGIFPSDVAFHHATHQFDVLATPSGDVHEIYVVQWTAPDLGGVVRVNGLVRVDLGTDSVVKTVDGDSYYSWKSKVGTRSLSYADAIYARQIPVFRQESVICPL